MVETLSHFEFFTKKLVTAGNRYTNTIYRYQWTKSEGQPYKSKITGDKEHEIDVPIPENVRKAVEKLMPHDR
jgi:hypothetical protein